MRGVKQFSGHVLCVLALTYESLPMHQRGRHVDAARQAFLGCSLQYGVVLAGERAYSNGEMWFVEGVLILSQAGCST